MSTDAQDWLKVRGGWTLLHGLNNNTCSSIITVSNVPQVSVEIEVTENDDETIHVEHCLIYIDSSIDN